MRTGFYHGDDDAMETGENGLVLPRMLLLFIVIGATRHGV